MNYVDYVIENCQGFVNSFADNFSNVFSDYIKSLKWPVSKLVMEQIKFSNELLPHIRILSLIQMV